MTDPSALLLEVNERRHALPLSCVREVVAAASVTEIPRAPLGVVGVISLRGAITTVFELGVLLGGAAGASDAPRPIVLVDVGGEVVGLRVTRVLRVTRDPLDGASAAEELDPARLVGARARLATPGAEG